MPPERVSFLLNGESPEEKGRARYPHIGSATKGLVATTKKVMRATQFQLLSAACCAGFAAFAACTPAPTLNPADTTGLDDDFGGSQLAPALAGVRGRHL